MREPWWPRWSLRAGAGGGGRDPLLIFAVEGSGFLYHMVRTIVGTVLQVGTGHWEAGRVAGVAEPVEERRNRVAESHGVPPQHVYLGWKEMARAKKFADAVIIATPGRNARGSGDRVCPKGVSRASGEADGPQ